MTLLIASRDFSSGILIPVVKYQIKHYKMLHRTSSRFTSRDRLVEMRPYRTIFLDESDGFELMKLFKHANPEVIGTVGPGVPHSFQYLSPLQHALVQISWAFFQEFKQSLFQIIRSSCSQRRRIPSKLDKQKGKDIFLVDYCVPTATLASDTLRARPLNSLPFNSLMAAAISSACSIVTKQNPRSWPEFRSRIILISNT